MPFPFLAAPVALVISHAKRVGSGKRESKEEHARWVDTDQTAELGNGPEEVYAFTFPSLQELARLKGATHYPVKIGYSGNQDAGAIQRIRGQIIEAAAFPERPALLLVGFGRPKQSTRVSWIVPEVSPGFTWPAVLQPRRAVTIVQRIDRNHKFARVSRPVFVRTECGVVKYGWSEAMNWFEARQDESPVQSERS